MTEAEANISNEMMESNVKKSIYIKTIFMPQ